MSEKALRFKALAELASCTSCPRMRHQFASLRQTHPDYWNLPVPPDGPVGADLMIVGLAPGKHGANRTGKPFTGDAAGEWLYDALESFNLTTRTRITNAVKCLPPANLPNKTELSRCNPFLANELANHLAQPGKVILTLGGVAHRATLRALGRTGPAFTHGGSFQLADDRWLFDSYHCSRYNTQTRRLTKSMFYQVFEQIGLHLR